LRVIDHVGKLVARQSILAPDEKVSEVLPCRVRLRAEIEIGKTNRLVLRNLKTVVGIRMQHRAARLARSGPAAVVVDRLVVRLLVRSLRNAGEVFARAGAGIDKATQKQLL